MTSEQYLNFEKFKIVSESTAVSQALIVSKIPKLEILCLLCP